jgi:hypothetical protein
MNLTQLLHFEHILSTFTFHLSFLLRTGGKAGGIGKNPFLFPKRKAWGQLIMIAPTAYHCHNPLTRLHGSEILEK